MLYLDYNATAPMLPEARDAMVQALDALWANPHSPHGPGQAAAAAVDRARSQVAALFGRDPRECIFTSGATESNALALRGLRSPERPEVWVSAVEHPSALAWGDRKIPVDSRGVLDLAALERMLASDGARVAVLSVMAANNETGVIQPIEAAAALARAHGVLFHSDATQLVGRLPARVDADLISLSAHKLGGPKGVGALISARRLSPILRGGSQERGLRAGTLNVPGIVAFGVAAELAMGAPAFPSEQRDLLEAAALARGATVLGAGAPRLPNTLSVLFDLPGDLLVVALDLAGICASTGSACASGAAEPSHVVAAMGLRGVPVRFSLGRDSRVHEAILAMNTALDRLEAVCA